MTKKVDGDYVVESWIDGPGIYLDINGLSNLAKNPSLRNKFLNLFRKRGTLLISGITLIELAPNVGQLGEHIRSLFFDIGTAWYPINPDPFAVMEKENSKDQPDPSLDARFLKMYLLAVTKREGDITIHEAFETVRGQDQILLLKSAAGIAGDMVRKHLEVKERWNGDPEFRKNAWKGTLAQSNGRLMRIHGHLTRCLLDQKNMNFEINDAFDLMHAEVPAAYADILMLDKHWANLLIQSKAPAKAQVFAGNDFSGLLKYYEDGLRINGLLS